MELAKLISLSDNDDVIVINSLHFTLGRSLFNSHVIKDVCISRRHCILDLVDGKWFLTDKSFNGTDINSEHLTKNETHQIEDTDIIQLTDTIKYRFHTDTDTHIPAKRRRIDKISEDVENDADNLKHKSSKSSSPASLHSSSTESITDLKEVSSNGSHVEITELQNDLVKLKNQNNLLEKLNSEKMNKILNLQIDLFNKTTANVTLEQENMELRTTCGSLEKEKDELFSQVLDKDCEMALLKMEMENKKPEENGSSKLEQNEDSNVEDKKLLGCLLRAEIFDRECTVKEKLSNNISYLKDTGKKKIDPLFFKKALKEIQSDIDELISKRNELEHSTREEMFVDGSENKTKADMLQIMEEEFQCSVCNEYLVKPTVLNCKHTFCNLCILRWRKQKNNCPVCRVPISSIVECMSLDTYIDQVLFSLSPHKKEARLQLRQTYEASTSGLQQRTSGNNNRGQRDEFAQSIFISSSSDSDTDDDYDDYDDDDDDDEEFDHDYSDAYYGGYGRCYICGARGHWANGCPSRRSR